MQRPYQLPPVSNDKQLRAIGAAIGLALMVILIIASVYVTMKPSERMASLYRPGDCVQTPVVKHQELEPWEEQKFSQLFMISEVGEHRYHLREWGTRISSYPQWYVDSYTDLRFALIDDRAQYEPVPCPEQGPDPDLDEAVSQYVITTFRNGERIQSSQNLTR